MINKISEKKGFTLIELIVTMAIAGIVMAFGVPSFRAMITSNRTATTANTLVAALSFAKSEAVKTGQAVWVGRSGAGWANGWAVFTDTNTNDIYNAGTDTLLKIYGAIPNGYTLTTGTNAAKSIQYLSTGLLGGLGNDTFVLCDSDQDTAKAREIILNTVGRVYTKTATSSCP